MKDTIKNQIESLKGLRIFNIEHTDDKVMITLSNGACILMYHKEECSESVWLESINGNLRKVMGAKFQDLLVKSQTWEKTCAICGYYFYTLVTSKGYIDFRFQHESNGYYSTKITIEIQ